MDVGQTSMIAGIGCRSGVSLEQVEAAINAAINVLQYAEAANHAVHAIGTTPPPRLTLSAIATPAAKAGEPGITTAAASRGVPLLLISQEALEAASPGALTRSGRSLAAMNVPSVAESAALAAAEPAPRLLAPRIAVGPVTCALADIGAPALPASADADMGATAPGTNANIHATTNGRATLTTPASNTTLHPITDTP
jgi:cobalt-precorrin 5A hydrolase